MNHAAQVADYVEMHSGKRASRIPTKQPAKTVTDPKMPEPQKYTNEEAATALLGNPESDATEPDPLQQANDNALRALLG